MEFWNPLYIFSISLINIEYYEMNYYQYSSMDRVDKMIDIKKTSNIK